MRVFIHSGVASFLSRARPWLLRAEVENCLIWSICDQLLTSLNAVRDVYLATVEEGEAVAACALRTPPNKAVITRGSEPALKCLVESLGERYETLPAVLGPEPEVRRFAVMWAQHFGSVIQPGMRQRIYEARQVQPLPWQVSGRMRQANNSDLPILSPWIAALNEETQVTHGANPTVMARERIAQSRLFVWEDGPVVSMAAQGSRTNSGALINLVYTPPGLRGRGYASACVAALTKELLSKDHAYCCLFTDLENQTSNSIYPRIGYRPVCDMTDYNLAPG
ncbi:MAG: GNAT family N-acetyltransferase [Deltaproteobacteria bacterium]|nr:GNAT family N-acetyltransferase [Deltaproteobacteria bacterium]